MLTLSKAQGLVKSNKQEAWFIQGTLPAKFCKVAHVQGADLTVICGTVAYTMPLVSIEYYKIDGVVFLQSFCANMCRADVSEAGWAGASRCIAQNVLGAKGRPYEYKPPAKRTHKGNGYYG